MNERESRLVSLGFSLDGAPSPQANYVPAVVQGGLAYLSGALPTDGPKGLLYRGQVGAELDLAAAQGAAALCAANLLRAFRDEVGSLEQLARVVRLGVYVSAAAGFSDAHLVANGASNLLGEVLGECGRHARSAICVPALPLGAAVEVDAIFALRAP